jgi:tetratricopeptide (TPR) repeat protein
MKSIRYLIICWALVYYVVPTKGESTPVYRGVLRYHSTEKAELVKKEFSDALNKVAACVLSDNRSHFHLLENKDIVITLESVSFNVLKNKRFTFLCANKEEIKIFEDASDWSSIDLQGLTVYWKTKDFKFAKRFADDLVYFQNMGHLGKIIDVDDFDVLAAKYRTLKVKPGVSEEERKYIVQANAQTQMKNYKQAIELYEKAIEVDATNPMVYNNEALLLAIVGQFDEAINSMKKYLMLVPEAVDARAAQDKIYEWEGMIKK